MITSTVAKIKTLMNELRTSSAITSSDESSAESQSNNKSKGSISSRSVESNHRSGYSEKASKANTKNERDSTSLDRRYSYRKKIMVP